MDGGTQMKAAKTTLRAILLAAAAATVMVALAGCPNPVGDLLNAKSWGLLGTWVSSRTIEYSPGMFYMLTVNADGTFRSEDQLGMSVSAGTYTVDSVTVSGSARTFQIHYVWGPLATQSHHYVLARVTDGTSYASNYTTMLPYPTLVDTGGPGYMTATLQ